MRKTDDVQAGEMIVEDAKDLFRTRDHVPDFEGYLKEYAGRSALARHNHRAVLDLEYGPEPDEKLDLFLPPPAAARVPVHLFIHGGYWRMFSKDDFSFIADTVVAAGAIAAVMDYSLMPAVRMETIVAQVRRAADWLVANIPRFGGDPNQLSVSGHSAGAHLCCTLLQADIPVAPKRALLLAGIYDLKPLRSSFLQPMIGLTEDEVTKFSPLSRNYRAGGDVLLLVGEQETLPFHSQADAMRSRLAAQQVPTRRIDIPDSNHMSIALDLGAGSTAVGQLLTAAIKSTGG
ncbi:alpha/beta hydrolase [Devosia sp. 1566]|uniref:alpha/beta hydrolase n=1 Tax=Devosia sp. 1566 TaxID=2499144 RepID=UPI0020BF56D1|nr:alpha/beta hydrolase [Devosia sp. 1566]